MEGFSLGISAESVSDDMSAGNIMRKIFNHILLPILSACLILALFCGCREESGIEINNDQPVEEPDQELWNARIEFTQNELTTSILEASHISIYEKSGLTVADSSFRLDIFDSEGNHSSVLFADSGIVSGEDSLRAYKNVIVISDSGAVLNTERLYWNRSTNSVRSDTFVVLTTETDTLFGDSMVSDESLENWQVFNPRGKTIRELNKN